MITYYAKDRNKIVRISATPFSEEVKSFPDFKDFEWNETEEAIVTDSLGQFYLQSEAPVVDNSGVILDRFNSEVINLLNNFAQEHQWDSIQSALVQQGAFKQDAIKAQEQYDLVWDAAIRLSANIANGSLDLSSALAVLPTPKWS